MKSDTNDALSLEQSGTPEIGLRRINGSHSPTLREGNVLVQNSAFPETDALVFGSGNGVEDLLLAKNNLSRIAYEVALPKGWKLFQPKGIHWLAEVRDSQGLARFRVKAEKGWDASGQTVPIKIVIDQNVVHVEPSVPVQYPIVIDPIWEATSTMVVARYLPGTCPLPNGKVLLAGGTTSGEGIGETFDPQSGTFTASNNSIDILEPGVTTMLMNGKVLLPGGVDNAPSSYLYDPGTNEFSLAAPMHTARFYHTSTRLQGGDVLVTGGYVDLAGKVAASAEIYDVKEKKFRSVGAMTTPRAGHVAALLPSGKILLVGGNGGVAGSRLSSTEVFDPVTESFSSSAEMLSVRDFGVAALSLPNGRIFIGGGTLNGDPAFAEIYDPLIDSFSIAKGAGSVPSYPALSMRGTGHVLICGGLVDNVSPIKNCTDYDVDTDRPTIVDGLLEARGATGAAILPSGAILVAGGFLGSNFSAAAELLESVVPETVANGSLSQTRGSQTATLLGSGKTILYTGGAVLASSPNAILSLDSAELLSVASMESRSVPPMAVKRSYHTASLLRDGRVLIAGGTTNQSDSLSIAELFDPVGSVFVPAGSLAHARRFHTATMLQSDKVLLTGGLDGDSNPTSSAEIFSPDSNTFSSVGDMTVPRYGHTATVLPSGKVLIVGSSADGADVPSADMFDPATGGFESLPPPRFSRIFHSATSLANGDVLIAGGIDHALVADAEIFDVKVSGFRSAGSLATARIFHTANLLDSGKVLIAGGESSQTLASTEIYDPASLSFADGGGMPSFRTRHSATRVDDGRILFAGGFDPIAKARSKVDIYDPIKGFVEHTSSFAARSCSTVAALPDGKIMLAGGRTDSALNRGAPVNQVATALVEIYDPQTGVIDQHRNLIEPRYWHTVTTLATGSQLIVGGRGTSASLRSVERYDPLAQESTLEPPASDARSLHSATWLPSGAILLAGGSNETRGTIDTLEVIDPNTGARRVLKQTLPGGRVNQSAMLLADGKVAIVGGESAAGLAQEIALFDPATETLASGGHITLPDPVLNALSGSNLIATGMGNSTAETMYRIDTRTQTSSSIVDPIDFCFAMKSLPGGLIAMSGHSSAATFDPATTGFSEVFSNNVELGVLGDVSIVTAAADAFTNSNAQSSTESLGELWHTVPAAAPRPTLLPLSQAMNAIAVGSDVELRGTRFTTPSSVGANSAPPSNDITPVLSFRPANGGPPVFATITAFNDTSLTAHFPPTVYLGPGYLHVIVRGVPSIGQFANLSGSPQGNPCTYDGECIPITVGAKTNNSGYCVDGFCCNTLCEGTCQACSADKQDPDQPTPPAAGVCLPAKAGTNPKNGCATEEPSTCGQTGTCSGTSNACAVYPDGTDCPNGKCSKGSCAVGESCDGEDNLIASPGAPPSSCSPFRCRDRHCLTSCTSNVDCAQGRTCTTAGACETLPFNGDGADSGCAASARAPRDDVSWLVLAGIVSIAVKRRRRCESDRRAA